MATAYNHMFKILMYPLSWYILYTKSVCFIHFFVDILNIIMGLLLQGLLTYSARDLRFFFFFFNTVLSLAIYMNTRCYTHVCGIIMHEFSVIVLCSV